MLANPPKDHPLPACSGEAIYYFPEIPCHRPSAKPIAHGEREFVGQRVAHHTECRSRDGERRQSAQVRCQLEDAFNKGKAQGQAAALAAQQDKIDRAVAALDAALTELERLREADCRRMERETVRLALAIAKKIIGYESRCGAMVARVVQSAMRKVTDTRNLTLKLNPQDLDTVKTCRSEWLPSDDTGTEVRLEADENLQRGGCLVETQLGDVDARIESQIGIVEAALIEQLSPCDSSK